ncbi:hypothetical protein MAR_019399 [Mya arenaria]|uniref:t-SNARE coiled-coil homology domain-containing protein n=1 Tax=Mya arenaria TaxID=6604 RepID=A0ABY7EL22_MYAAR|nr:hypothetical protein MAR_019399 [Mya arenaria]
MAEKEENEESKLEKNSTMMEEKYKNHLVGSRINFYENKTRSDMLHKPEEPRVSKSKIPDVLLLDAGRLMEQEGEEANIKKEIAATNISKRKRLITNLTQKPQHVNQEATETSSENLVAGDSDSGSESALDFNITAEHIYFPPDFENSNITDRKSFATYADDISQGEGYVHSNSSRFGSFNASDSELQFQHKIALYDISQKSEKEMIKIESVVSDGLEMVNEGIADGISEIHNQIDEAETRLKHIYSKIDLQGDDSFRNSLRKTRGLIKPKKSGRPSILNIFNHAKLDEAQAKSDVDPDRHNEEMGKLHNRLAEYYLDRFDSVPLSPISPEHDQKLTALYVCPEICRQKGTREAENQRFAIS